MAQPKAAKRKGQAIVLSTSPSSWSSSRAASSSSSSSPSPSDEGILARLTNYVRESALYVKSKGAASSSKLLSGTGRAAWILGTSFLVLVVPLIIELDREAQLTELEGHQASLLGAPAQSGLPLK